MLTELGANMDKKFIGDKLAKLFGLVLAAVFVVGVLNIPGTMADENSGAIGAGTSAASGTGESNDGSGDGGGAGNVAGAGSPGGLADSGGSTPSVPVSGNVAKTLVGAVERTFAFTNTHNVVVASGVEEEYWVPLSMLFCVVFLILKVFSDADIARKRRLRGKPWTV